MDNENFSTDLQEPLFIRVYKGYALFLSTNGLFATTSPEVVLTDPSLGGLQKKIDEHYRALERGHSH